MLREPPGVRPQGFDGPSRYDRRQHLGRGAPDLRNLSREIDRRGFLQDQVRVGAADPKGRNSGPARPLRIAPPRLGLLEQSEPAVLPAHLGTRHAHVQRLGQALVVKRQNHLDGDQDPYCCLCMADVGFARPKPEGPPPRSGRPKHLRERPSLNRVSQRRSSAVRFDGVDVIGAEAARGEPGE